MNLESLRNASDKILDPGVQDESGLNDFQKMPNDNPIAIDLVGIERFRIPMTFKHNDGTIMNHDGEASMYVYLCKGKTGINMSRLCTILQEEANSTVVSPEFINNTLTRYKKELRDFETEDLIQTAKLNLKFNFPVKQKSLRSENWGWQYYECSVGATAHKNDEILIELQMKYEYSSTCPCSLSMAKQYEEEYRQGKTTLGNGIASAHSQRSTATVTVKFKYATDFWIEDLLTILREALPTETQSLVKRIDEQAFAILNGDNPMFVEHASRRLSFMLDKETRILDWEAKVDHVESLHSHNAVAFIRKKI